MQYMKHQVKGEPVACSDGGAGGARHTLAPKKKGAESAKYRC